MTTEPQGAYMIWLPAGGSKSPPSAETVARGEHRIRMEGKETYRFATRTLASTALAAVGKAGWTQDDVDLIVPHQANIRIIEAVAKGLDISMDKIYVNLDRYGNTSAASVPLALAEAVERGPPGRSATSWSSSPSGPASPPGAVAMEWTADPARGRTADEAVRPEDVIRPAAPGLGFRGPDPARAGGGPRPAAARPHGPVRRRARRARARQPRQPRPERHCPLNPPGARRDPPRGGRTR